MSRDVPLALHSQVIDGADGERDATADRLGGKRYSGAFLAYMGAVLPRSVAEERWGRQHWSEVPYVLGRMYARFGKETVDAVVRIERDGADLDEVAAVSGLGRVKLCRDISRMRKLNGAYYRHGISHQKIRVAKSVRDDTRSDWHEGDD